MEIINGDGAENSATHNRLVIPSQPTKRNNKSLVHLHYRKVNQGIQFISHISAVGKPF